MTTPAELIAAARGLVGARWVDRGRTDRGVDCIGLVVLSLAHAGVELREQFGVRIPSRYDEPQPQLLARVKACCREIEAPVPGCLLLMLPPRARIPIHFAILTEAASIVHAHPRLGYVAEEPYGPAYRRITSRRWLLPGVAYNSNDSTSKVPHAASP